MSHEFTPEVLAQLKRLEEKYAADGQDLAGYLEGLYYTDYLNYWDYIHLDTLLSLQNPEIEHSGRKDLYHVSSDHGAVF